MKIIPKGYRLLVNGEKIKADDLFYQYAAQQWKSIRAQRGMTGKIYNATTYVEMIRKKEDKCS